MYDIKICIIGLGYVGLPLAVAFSKIFNVVGFDINRERIEELKNCIDSTREVEAEDLLKNQNIYFTSDENDLGGCDFYIVTVPTPIDNHRQPDLNPLIKASELLGRIIKVGTTIIYESTVYPGATEEDCIPVVERVSGLRFNIDFFAGYSPERINPGDKTRPVTNIMKVTSGSNDAVAERVDWLYRQIITAGTFKASSIKVAEASKIIENTQRDVNIALINELSIIFDHLSIDVHEVIEAASTKWNFIKLKPGFVGGHCIGVDPYYLVHKSMSAGYVPDIIRTAREINDGMPKHVAAKYVKEIILRDIQVKGAKILVMGLSFKENCPDTRNSKTLDFIYELVSYGLEVDVFDPVISQSETENGFGVRLVKYSELSTYDSFFLAVAHKEFLDFDFKKHAKDKEKNHVFDFKKLL